MTAKPARCKRRFSLEDAGPTTQEGIPMSTELDEPPTEAAPPRTPWWRRTWVVAAAVGAVAGLAGGAGIALAASDPTRSEEYTALSEQLDRAKVDKANAQDATRDVEDRLSDANDQIAAYKKAEAELKEREQAAADREAAVSAREQAVTATEQRIIETTILERTWTVGRDIEPGTYATREAVSSGNCYWAIYMSGTNGGNIVENDIVTGGVPTVTLSEGQDFTSNRCGSWVKQG